MTAKVLWDVVRAAAAREGIDRLAPHDLRRTCARLCHLAGGALDQIQFLLGHVSTRRRSATSAASRSFGTRSTTFLASSPIRLDAAVGRANAGSALRDSSFLELASTVRRGYVRRFGASPSRISRFGGNGDGGGGGPGVVF
jgi:hypothetical protein